MIHKPYILILLFFVIHFSSLIAQPLANGKSKFLGNVIGNGYSIRSDFSKYWNQVTPENSGKWGSVEGSQDAYGWAPLDLIYNYAVANNFPYKHHAFVWGQQYPTWITSLDSAEQRAQVEEWIRLCAQRYPNMDMVDVVNEPFHAPPPFKNALGGDGVTGWDWVITSFQWARQYCDSSTQLILNDYSILHSNSVTDNYLKLIDTLKVRGLIDAIGIQCHSFELLNQSPVSIENNLKRLAATGIPIYITEFDINLEDDTLQLQNYRTYFPIFWENPGVKGITFWGYVYGNIWQTNGYLLDERNAKRPAFTWLINYINCPYRPTLIPPINVGGIPRNPTLVWHPNDTTATSFRLQISTVNTFNTLLLDTIITDTMLQIDPLPASSRVYWRVSASNNHGTGEFSYVGAFVTGTQIVSVTQSDAQPTQFALSQNYPNPFNPTTIINYVLPNVGTQYIVSLRVSDLLGREVATLFEGTQQAGNHNVTFDGSRLASGIYFYRLQTRYAGSGKNGNFIETKKLVLMK